MKNAPRRGEVWLVDLGMVEKIRPALVLSGPCGDNDRDILTVIPHTTTLRGSRFEIHVPMPFLKPGAFLAQSPATVPAPRAQKLLGRMTDAQVRLVEDGLLAWLEIIPR
jgi:mRNA interferase MazF